MEIKITTTQIIKVLYVLSWIIFVGVCVDSGGFIFNTFYTLAINPTGAEYFWDGINLMELLNYDRGHFFAQTLLICIVAIMRAFLFYLIVKILHDKKLNMSKPFNKEVGRFVFNVSYLSLGIGMFSYWGARYSEWLVSQGVTMPAIEHLHIGGADVWMFMGVTLFVIAQIFKKGIEIQNENELTI